ncbi:MAG: tRNA 2-thiouridine(34) synthase MnmA [Dehalococcoidia bacterium]|nr:tRNA 2-thiouridine(34) synthase MnmA [Dehalococcoidia bacterium]
MSKRTRVVVAMSGGVDSAVAAGLLARGGYDVVGITMRLSTREDPDAPATTKRCCSVEDTEDARRAADAIGIPHYVLNLEREFRERVVDAFVGEYARGRTPNPCLACNEHLKFRALLDRAVALDAGYLATGHYARIERRGERYALRRAADVTKDQSYVLYTMGQAELAKTLFPVGAYEKARIRELAREMRLDLAEKPDSVDICFVPDGDYRRFVRTRLAAAPGVMRDGRGEVVGAHDGVAGFTIGQRKGLGRAFGERRFVTGIDAERKVITVGPEEALLARAMVVEDVRWVAGEAPRELRASVKIRYRTAPAPATVARLPEGRARVVFDEPQRAITPGQAAVFYDDDEVLGGGAILQSERG